MTTAAALGRSGGRQPDHVVAYLGVAGAGVSRSGRRSSSGWPHSRHSVATATVGAPGAEVVSVVRVVTGAVSPADGSCQLRRANPVEGCGLSRSALARSRDAPASGARRGQAELGDYLTSLPPA
jgi:hypothetical protein